MKAAPYWRFLHKKSWLELAEALLGLALPLAFMISSSYIFYLLCYWLRFGMDHFLNILPPLLAQFFVLTGVFLLIGSLFLLGIFLYYSFMVRPPPFEAWFEWCKEQAFVLVFLLGCAFFLVGTLGVIHAELILGNPAKKRCLIKANGIILKRKFQFLGSVGDEYYFYDRRQPQHLLRVPKKNLGYVRFL